MPKYLTIKVVPTAVKNLVTNGGETGGILLMDHFRRRNSVLVGTALNKPLFLWHYLAQRVIISALNCDNVVSIDQITSFVYI